MQRLVAAAIALTSLSVSASTEVGQTVVQGSLSASQTITSVSLKSAWGLSDAEVSRLLVVREIAGPHVDLEMISPVELLGIYAETAEQRKEYARRYIRAQQEHRVKSMEWAITVASIAASEAGSFASGSPMISEYGKHTDQSLDQARHEYFKGGRYEQNNPPASFTTQFATRVQQNAVREIAKRAVVYVEFDCNRCDRAVTEALEKQRNTEIPGVDVIFSGVAGNAQKEISEWAVRMGVTQAEVGSRSVTLNYETKYWLEKRAGRKIPLVISTDS